MGPRSGGMPLFSENLEGRDVYLVGVGWGGMEFKTHSLKLGH